MGILAYLTLSRPEICDNDPPMSCSWPDWVACQILSRSVKKVWPPSDSTQTDTRTKSYVCYSCITTRRCPGRIVLSAINFRAIFKPAGIMYDTQYLHLISMIHHAFAYYLGYTIFRYIVYPCSAIFVSVIHDTVYYCLISMVHNIYVCYQRYNIFISNVRDTKYLRLISTVHDYSGCVHVNNVSTQCVHVNNVSTRCVHTR